jgi:hypothetical protein
MCHPARHAAVALFETDAIGSSSWRVLMLQISGPTIAGLLGPRDTQVVADRVRGEFKEMPGLALTLAQAVRLWNLDEATCAEVLSQLVSAGFLCRRPDGAFCRASDFN